MSPVAWLGVLSLAALSSSPTYAALARAYAVAKEVALPLLLAMGAVNAGWKALPAARRDAIGQRLPRLAHFLNALCALFTDIVEFYRAAVGFYRGAPPPPAAPPAVG
jgi:hypothetical protein